jgi:hypothetical protein
VCGGRGAGGVSVCVNLQVGSVGRSVDLAARPRLARLLACLLVWTGHAGVKAACCMRPPSRHWLAG